MTYAAVPTLRHNPDLAAQYEPGLRLPHYDFGLRPPASKAGLLAGMSMTEKQGGSDLRAGTTVAVPDGAVTDAYRLTGHKWFTSAPMNDVFLTVAQAPAGPDLLPAAPRTAGRQPERHLPATAEGQAGQPVERVRGDRVRRRRRLADRRRGPRRADHSRDGHDDQAGLRAGFGRTDPGSAVPGRLVRGPSRCLRRCAGRPTGDDGRAGRPGRGVLGGHPHRDPAGRAVEPSRPTWAGPRPVRRRCCGWRSRWPSSGSANARCR